MILHTNGVKDRSGSLKLKPEEYLKKGKIKKRKRTKGQPPVPPQLHKPAAGTLEAKLFIETKTHKILWASL